MKNFTDHIPPDVMLTPNVQRFMKVLDGLNDYKQEVIRPYDYAFNFAATMHLHILRKFFYELGQMEYIGGMPHHLLKQFIANAYDIFHLKGTRKGEKLLIRSLCDGDIETDTSKLYGTHYLQPGNYSFGYLPNGVNLGVAGTPQFIYLFGNTVVPYYTEMKVGLVGPYFYVPEFRNFIAKILPDFLCMVDIRTCQLTINFYGHGHVPIASVPVIYNPILP